MKHFKIAYLTCLIIMSSTLHGVVPTYRVRPQGINRPRELVGLLDVLYQEHQPSATWSGNLYAAPFFAQSMKPRQIGTALFGCDAIPCDDGFIIKVQGVNFQGEDRDPRAWLADNFYLNSDFSSELYFRPEIKNVGLDLGFYVDLHRHIKDSYLRIHAPLVHTKWNLHYREKVIAVGGPNNAVGLLAPVDIAQFGFLLLPSFSEYVQGEKTITMQAPSLHFAHINSQEYTKTTLADLTLEYGYIAHRSDTSHIGLYAQAIIPTGTKRNESHLLFAPQVGNDHHWGIGFGAHGHYDLWHNECSTKLLTFHADIGLSHLFANNQIRTFDLKDKPLSRYMLASHFGPNNGFINGTIEGNGARATTTFFPLTAAYSPVANLTTAEVKVSIGIQADLVALVNYTHNNWSYDIGYNFWAQSCEKIRVNCNQCTINEMNNYEVNTLFAPLPDNYWGLKGDARMWGWRSNVLSLDDFLPLSATESKADIHNGTNKIPIIATPLLAINQNIDNPLPATILDGTEVIYNLRASGIQVNTSIQPVLLSCDDVDVSGNRGISNKIFAHASRSWPQEHYIPFLGLGGEVEWGSVGNSKCAGCKNSALSQWSMWFKGGISFN